MNRRGVTGLSTTRLVVFGALVLSLMVTLAGRFFQLQVLEADRYATIASDNRTRDVVRTAMRGQIVDQAGRPMVANRSSLVITADPTALRRQADRGAAVLARLGRLVGIPGPQLAARMKQCGTSGAPRPPLCWNGSAVQPVPLVKDASQDIALAVMERSDEFQGITADVQGVRSYPAPFGVNAAHVLGYLQPVSDSELQKQAQLPREERWLLRTDLVGRAGLESTYDRALRGKPGLTKLIVDRQSRVVGSREVREPTTGQTLVTSIDSHVQAVAEKALAESVALSRARGYRADSGAIVVLDVTNGSVLGLASWPTYDPKIWVGRIDNAQYQALLDSKKGIPLLFRPTQGLLPPGSTFKVITTAAALKHGWSGNSRIPCPPTYTVGRRKLSNFDGEAAGSLTLAEALEMSCNTVYYRIGHQLWLRDGGLKPKGTPVEALYKEAKSFHLGQRTGIDMAAESRGRIVGRLERKQRYDRMKAAWCRRAKNGYPEYKNRPAWASYLKAIAAENCADGYQFRGGDAALFAIGQGDTLVTPLQMAVAYAAIANGGTLWRPHLAKGFVSPNGKVERLITPVKLGKLDLTAAQLAVIQRGLRMVVTGGTARVTFSGYPNTVVPVAGKTGTAQMGGNNLQETSWFASFAPANKPRYAVVAVVSQGGTGASSAAVAVRKVYDGIFGVVGGKADPGRSILAGGAPVSGLPKFRSDGTAVVPNASPSASPSSRAFAPVLGFAAVVMWWLPRRRRR